MYQPKFSRRPGRRTRPALLACEPRQYLAGTPLGDLNTQPGEDFLPTEIFSAGNVAYFFKSDGVHGAELFKTDGTSAGTALVKDIQPGLGSSSSLVFPPSFARTSDGTLFFTADDGKTGAELWKSDGTAAGTVRVKDVRPGSLSSGPTKMLATPAGVFFFANDGVHGYELWVTDGTDAGTHLVADLNPGAAGQSSTSPAYLGGYVYFEGTDGVTAGLYKSTGAAGNATLVKADPSPTSHFTSLTVFDDRLFASVGNATWVSDGTTAGTTAFYTGASRLTPTAGALYLSNNSDIYRLTPGDAFDFFQRVATTTSLANVTASPTGDIFYTGQVFDTSRHLYQLRAGSATPSDVFAFPIAALAPTNFRFVGQDLYLSTGNYDNGYTLWSRRAATGVTAAVAPLGSRGSAPALFTAVGARLVFVNDDPATDAELWSSDGTAANTSLIRDLNPATDDSIPFFLGSLGDQVFFAAFDSTGTRSLWSVRPGAAPVPLAPSTAGAGRFLATGNRAFVSAGDAATTGAELWVTDGTAANTRLFKDINPGAAASSPANLTSFDGRVYFTADDGVHGIELWVTDGTPDNTHLVTDVNPTGSANPSLLTPMGGRLYFLAQSTSSTSSSSSTDLWVTDGTPEGTQKVRGTAAPAFSSPPTKLTAFNGALYFVAGTSAAGAELWRSDGTAAGTAIVKDINPGATGASIGRLVVAGDYLAFPANDGATGLEIWHTDGTAAGTTRLTDLSPGAASSATGNLGALDDLVIWVANDAGGVERLWKTTPTGVSTELAQIYSPDAWPNLIPAVMTMSVANGRLFFLGALGETGLELWSTDGTPEGTGLTDDVNPGFGSGVSSGPIFVGPDGSIYATGNNGVTGWEPYRFADTFAPRVSTSRFDAATGRGVQLTFSEPLAAANPYQVRVSNLDTGQDLAPGAYQLAYDPATRTLTVQLPRTAANANYRVWATATDAAGNVMAAPATFDFFTLAGDATHDRVVNFDDLLALAKNYNKTAMTFAAGDFTGDGLVNFDDLLVLAKNYNKTLPQPGAPASPVTATPLSAAALLAAITPAAPTPTPAPAPTKKATPSLFSNQKVLPPAPPKKPAPPRKPATHR